MRLTTNRRLRNLEEIDEAIQSALRQVSEEHRNVIETRYWNNKRLTAEGVAQTCNMHRTVAKYRREFIMLVAEKIGWV